MLKHINDQTFINVEGKEKNSTRRYKEITAKYEEVNGATCVTPNFDLCLLISSNFGFYGFATLKCPLTRISNLTQF